MKAMYTESICLLAKYHIVP